MTKVLGWQDKTSNKRKRPSEDGQQRIDDYHNPTVLPSSKITRINCALVKFFVSCAISFHVIEYPFFINFIKELNGGYSPPNRDYLAGQLLERKLVLVNSKVQSEIGKKNNLTLVFDGWTFGMNRSIWFFFFD